MKWRSGGKEGDSRINNKGAPFKVSGTRNAPRHSAYDGGFPNQAEQETTPASEDGELGDEPSVDWLREVTPLQCYDDQTPMVMNKLQEADVTGDGEAETFVAYACEASTSSWPEQLEVFTVADSADVTKLATLYEAEERGESWNGLRLESIVCGRVACRYRGSRLVRA